MNFHAFVPVPPEIQAQTYNDAGYDWQHANWGTKWNAYDQELEEDGDSLLLNGDDGGGRAAMVARLAPRDRPAEGSVIRLGADPAEVHLFDPGSGQAIR